MGKRARVFEITQNEKNPITGEKFPFDEDVIKLALEHKQIKQWAYIKHDKDIYTQKDIELAKKRGIGLQRELDDGVPKENVLRYKQRIAYYNNLKVGDKKTEHWHVVVRCGTSVDVDYVAKWFNVPANNVHIPKGKGAFEDCVQYLTHERITEKHTYNDNEVKANFDFRSILNHREENREKYGRDLDATDDLMLRVMLDGVTLKEIEEENPVVLGKNLDRFKKWRQYYLDNYAEMPPLRINFYICGGSGSGKTTAAKEIAKALFPDVKNEKQLYHLIGTKNVSFEGYNEQPVIIWDDFRSWQIVRACGGDKGAVYNVLNLQPQGTKMHVKFGSVTLVNRVNIITSIQPFDEFLNGLVQQETVKDEYGNKEYHPEEDRGQAYRRFPFVLDLKKNRDCFTFMVNKGVWEDKMDDTLYDYWKYIIRGNFGKLIVGIEKYNLPHELMDKLTGGIVDKCKEFVERYKKENKDEKEKLLKEFNSYGTIKEEDKISLKWGKVDDEDIPF